MPVHTLYRLTDIPPTHEGMLDALDTEQLDELRFLPSFPDEHLGCPALLVGGHFDIPRVGWCNEISSLTGVELELGKLDTAALLMLAVDGEVYAMGFGSGYRLVPEEHKDRSFGLRVAVRSVDPDFVQGVVRRSLSKQGRQDATRVSLGLHISRVGVRQHDELVRQIGGRLAASDIGLPGVGRISIEGATGLRFSTPTSPETLLRCLRALTAICAAPPVPELEFIEAVQPVTDARTVKRLDEELDRRLLDPRDDSLQIAVPSDLSADLPHTSSYRIQVGSAALPPRDHLDVSDVRARARVQHAVTPSEALRKGKISLLSSSGTVLASAPAIRWIETDVATGFEHRFLLEGEWYESGADYMASIERQVAELIPANPSVALPAWRPGEHERDYNLRVQDELGRAAFLCLDRTSVKNALHAHNGIEVCDGLGPQGELICIKPADGSSPLSHQFNQALVAVETLLHDATARERFHALVVERSGGTRTPPPDARPKKVIFGIHLKTGRDLTPATLFPFARVALVNMATVLRHDVEVEVVGIPAVGAVAASAPALASSPSS
ncbi:DUF6119 family protein [Actinomadura parmotrematis]|uniref:TIGR04141 family sporadically distributed protein n=1 Tax=Actinomadura parmotrematis TaxID=2864039 RepID=A0ABS7FU65_9ACTN|nr:DUF6119 family protein [Actinomadura parmotrematis]MBW8483937.1 TIGR04141 family sporadically distributed protein [Actinomadura parmotrematis]